MRMKSAPSWVRIRANFAQSTKASVASSMIQTTSSSRAGRSVTASGKQPIYNLAGKAATAAPAEALAAERIAARARRQPHRHGAKAEILPEAVDEVAAVAFGQELGAVATGRGRRVLLDHLLEPAVERAGRHTLRPGLANLERRPEQGVDALAGPARDGQQRHAAGLGEALVERRLDAVEQLAGLLG